MDEQKLKTINEKISAILLEHNCTLQIAHTIQIVPNKPMEEEVTGTEVVEETAEVSGTETPTLEVVE